MLKKLPIILVFFIILFTCYADAALRCVVLDVGEGQAVLLQREQYGVIIDTGSFSKGYKVISALNKYGVKKIEKIILTHLHPDHASGIFTLKHHFPQAVIYESGHRVNGLPSIDSIRWVAEQLDSGDWNVKNVIQGSTLEWRGTKIEILWPEKLQGKSLNHMSLVIQAIYGQRQIIVMGDADTLVEERLLNQNYLPSNIDLLVVGHHGAKDATSVQLLTHLSPQVAVISVNSSNVRGYPHGMVVERIRSHGIQMHITSEHGDYNVIFQN